jgi:hypothetical protein
VDVGEGAGLPCADCSGAITAHSTPKDVRILAQIDGQKRRRGAEIGNRRAWRHGRRSAGAVLRRKSGAASRKAAGLLLARLDLLGDYRHRPRPIREDQHRHLGTETLDLLARLGLLG